MQQQQQQQTNQSNLHTEVYSKNRHIHKKRLRKGVHARHNSILYLIFMSMHAEPTAELKCERRLRLECHSVWAQQRNTAAIRTIVDISKQSEKLNKTKLV